MTAPIRIVRIIARLNVGGPTRHVVWLTQALQGGEFETTLVAGSVPPGEADMSDFAAAHGVTPVIVKEMSREISARDVITVWKIYRLLLALRPNVIHTHTAKAGTVGRLAGLMYRFLASGTLVGRPRRCAFVHTFHGHIFHSYYGRLKTAVFVAIEKFLARATDVIVVLSPQQLAEIRDHFGVGRSSRFEIVPLGLDLDAIRASASAGAALREEFGIGPDETVVGVAGRLTAIKNLEMFLRVAAHIGKRARFVVYGEGADRTALVAKAAELRLDNIVFAGTRDASAIYGSLDIAALTSLNEGTPLTLIEAMANAKPVISTAVGGVVDISGRVRETVPSGDTTYDIRERGITVASNDDAGFVAGLQRLLEDTDLRHRFASAGKAYADANCSRDRLIRDIAKLVREVAPR